MPSSSFGQPAKLHNISPSTSSGIKKDVPSPKKSEFHTTSYVKYSRKTGALMKDLKAAPKKYLFYTAGNITLPALIVPTDVIRAINETQPKFTIKEGILVYLAAERFNDPAKADLPGRSSDECALIFKQIVSDKKIFQAIQDAARKMDAEMLKDIMIDLPFTETEDAAIKNLSSKKPPTNMESDKLHLEHFSHFRGREAIEARYLFLRETYQLNDQPNQEEQLILPPTSTHSDQFAYLTAASTRELNYHLNVAKTLDQNPALTGIVNCLLNKPHLAGIINLGSAFYDVATFNNFLVMAKNKLIYFSTLKNEYMHYNYLSFVVKEKTIVFTNRFCVAVIINGLYLPTGANIELANNATHAVVIPEYISFTYHGNSAFKYELMAKNGTNNSTKVPTKTIPHHSYKKSERIRSESASIPPVTPILNDRDIEAVDSDTIKVADFEVNKNHEIVDVKKSMENIAADGLVFSSNNFLTDYIAYQRYMRDEMDLKMKL